MANISETSINRPVLSTVMMLVILLFGLSVTGSLASGSSRA